MQLDNKDVTHCQAVSVICSATELFPKCSFRKLQDTNFEPLLSGEIEDFANCIAFYHLKGLGKRGHIVADTLLLMMFLGCTSWETFVAETKCF